MVSDENSSVEIDAEIKFRWPKVNKKQEKLQPHCDLEYAFEWRDDKICPSKFNDSWEGHHRGNPAMTPPPPTTTLVQSMSEPRSSHRIVDQGQEMQLKQQNVKRNNYVIL